MDTKICRTCGLEKPLDAFDPGGPKNRPGYRRPHCKDCRNTTSRTAHANNPEPRQLAAKRFRERHPDTIKAWDKVRYQKTLQRYENDPALRQRDLEKSLAYNKAHPERVRENSRRWQAAHPDKVRARSKNWRVANPDKVRAMKRANYARRVATDPNYRKQQTARQVRNYARYRSSRLDAARRRRAMLAGAAIVEKIDRESIFERDRWICQLCFKAVPHDEATIDHVIPVAERGNHTYQNLVTAHLSCNQRKGARHVPQQQRLFG